MSNVYIHVMDKDSCLCIYTVYTVYMADCIQYTPYNKMF